MSEKKYSSSEIKERVEARMYINEAKKLLEKFGSFKCIPEEAFSAGGFEPKKLRACCREIEKNLDKAH